MQQNEQPDLRFPIVTNILKTNNNNNKNVCAIHACLVPAEVRRGLPITWNWNYRCLWGTTWLLQTKLRSSVKGTSVLNHWVLTPAPKHLCENLILRIPMKSKPIEWCSCFPNSCTWDFFSFFVIDLLKNCRCFSTVWILLAAFWLYLLICISVLCVFC